MPLLVDASGCAFFWRHVTCGGLAGAYDLVQQPSEIGELAKENVCFVMFVDEVTHESLLKDGTLEDRTDRRVGLWRLVVVTNIPYTDPRRTGKVGHIRILAGGPPPGGAPCELTSFCTQEDAPWEPFCNGQGARGCAVSQHARISQTGTGALGAGSCRGLVLRALVACAVPRRA